ncbi:MAG: hypothetical protein H7329_12105 [Opitutaceae bacterium]|nr:hypothetical protein [Cytophagales bacterium]
MDNLNFRVEIFETTPIITFINNNYATENSAEMISFSTEIVTNTKETTDISICDLTGKIMFFGRTTRSIKYTHKSDQNIFG